MATMTLSEIIRSARAHNDADSLLDFLSVCLELNDGDIDETSSDETSPHVAESLAAPFTTLFRVVKQTCAIDDEGKESYGLQGVAIFYQAGRCVIVRSLNESPRHAFGGRLDVSELGGNMSSPLISDFVVDTLVATVRDFVQPTTVGGVDIPTTTEKLDISVYALHNNPSFRAAAQIERHLMFDPMKNHPVFRNNPRLDSTWRVVSEDEGVHINTLMQQATKVSAAVNLTMEEVASMSATVFAKHVYSPSVSA